MRVRSLLGLAAFSLALLACDNSPPLPDDRAAIELVELAWNESDALPGAGDCLEGVEVVRYEARPEYVDACDSGHPGLFAAYAEKSAGCLTHASRGAFDRVPVIHVAPGFERDKGLVQHEALHALVGCALERPGRDLYDVGHSDPRIWKASGGASSVQAVALGALSAAKGRFTGAAPFARG